MSEREQKRYEDDLFKRLEESLALKEEKGILGRYFEKPVWWMFQKADKGLAAQLKRMELHCSISSQSDDLKTRCLGELCNIFAKAKKSKKAEHFKCAFGLSGFCYPIVQGRKIYGYIAMCHAQKDIPDAFIEMFVNFIDTLVREIQKELQLVKLYDTIRPRAIALSTVHTVHRLLTSTLDLDELLKRLARLSLQIVRANRCSIKLADKAKRVLLPKATIDLRKKKVKLKKVKVGMYAPGKAFKRAKVVMGKDYMAVPLIDQDVIGVITLYDKADGAHFADFDKEIMATLAEQAVIAMNNAMLYKEQEKMTEGAIKSLTSLLDTHAPGKLTPRAPYVKVVLEIGRIFRFSKEDLRFLEHAYFLHDVGKAVLPPSALTKAAKLSDKEYRLIKEHPMRGAMIIKPLKALRACVPMIMHQRERYDGKGYPDRLKGTKIPIGARIISVVSAFEAMMRKNYQAKRSMTKAVNEIKNNGGTQFDPKVVDAFLKVMERRHIKDILRR